MYPYPKKMYPKIKIHRERDPRILHYKLPPLKPLAKITLLILIQEILYITIQPLYFDFIITVKTKIRNSNFNQQQSSSLPPISPKKENNQSL